MANVKCVDVSEWQGSIDWKKVKAMGIEYAILRAGFGREVSQVDAEFERNYKNAKSAGLKLGVYWYSYADSVSDAEREAQACLSVLKNKAFELPVYYDLEDNSQVGLGKTVLTNIAKKFCDTVKASGYDVGVYANLNWFNNYLDYSALKKLYSIWLAQYHTEAELECDIWQYTSAETVSGISGGVDMNVIYNQQLLNPDIDKEAPFLANFEAAGVQALLRQAYAQGIVNTFVKPIDNKIGKLTNAAILEAKAALGVKNPDYTITLDFIADLEHLVNVTREANFDKARKDVNQDGRVNVRDATALQKEIAGIED